MQSCSTPSGGNTEQVLHFCKTNQTEGDNCWLREFVLISTALHCKPTWLFCLSHHTKICVSSWVCVMLEKTLWHFDICAQAVCVWPFFHIYETACLICKCQRRASGRSEDVFCCVTIKDTDNWQAGSKHMRGNKPWILSGSNTGCLCLWSGFEDSECSRYLPVSDVEICKIFLLVRCFAAKYYICELTQHWLLKI